MSEEPPASAPTKPQWVGRGDVVTVQELTIAVSRTDQRRGGGRRALVQYVQSYVARFLRSKFPVGA